MSEVIHDFQARIIEETERNGYDGHDIPKHKWNFSGALLYSITVITTIGETNQNYPSLASLGPYGPLLARSGYVGEDALVLQKHSL